MYHRYIQITDRTMYSVDHYFRCTSSVPIENVHMFRLLLNNYFKLLNGRHIKSHQKCLQINITIYNIVHTDIQ